MKILLILSLFLGGLAVSCQNSGWSSTPQTSSASPTQKSTDTSAQTTTQTPQLSTKTKAEPSAQSKSQVATNLNSPVARQQSCQISAYVIDTDPNGLNVRSGAGKSYEIIGKLPTTAIAVIVDLTASQGDWVQLSKAQSPAKIEFQGTGWVYAQLLGTSTRGYGSKGVFVYANADAQSSVVGRIPDQKGVKLLGCDRSWAWVEYQGLKGWLAPAAQCPNPLTTCP
jgi:uncharacterized protein YraI